MEIQEYIQKMKNIQNDILSFIENEEETEENYQNLTKFINEYNILKNRNEFRSFLHLINEILNNHNRTNKFFEKFEKIISSLRNEFEKYLSNSEIFMIFKNNKRILLFLLRNNIIQFDQFLNNYIKNDYNLIYLSEYFKTTESKDSNPSRITEHQLYEEGENELDICKIIRNDLIDEFITYVNKTNIPLKMTIKDSIYETNSFLLGKNPSLIEYAAFFGSIQIFKYLYKNQIALTPSLWTYAMHGLCPEIIHILEDEKIAPEDKTYKKCLTEAIKCHHNDFAYYINKNNYFENQPNINYFIGKESIQYYNYEFFPNDVINRTNFFDFCRFDYFYFVDYILKNKNFDINIETNEKINNYSYILSPLLVAIENDNTEIAEILLKQPEIDVNFRYTKTNWSYIEEKNNALILSIHNNNLRLVKLLLMNNKIDVNLARIIKKYNSYSTVRIDETFPLFEAILMEQPEIVKILLNHPNINVNVEKTSFEIIDNDLSLSQKTNILYEAVKSENIEIVDLLLKNPNIDTNMICFNMNSGEDNSLNLAIIKNNLEMVKLLLSNPKTDVNFISKNTSKSYKSTKTSLGLAIQQNNSEIVELLLSNQDIDVNMTFKVHEYRYEATETALSLAIKNNNEKIVKLLLKHKNIDVNKMIFEDSNDIKYNETPLLLAVKNKNFEMVNTLLSHEKIDVNIKGTMFKSKTNYEWNALLFSIFFKYIEITQLLLTYPKIDINGICVIKNGSYSLIKHTALSMAIENLMIDVSNFILNNSEINVNFKYYHVVKINDIIEEIPILHKAILSKNTDIIKNLLSKQSINVNAKSVIQTNKKDVIEKIEKTTLDYAIDSSNREIIQLFLVNDKIDFNLKSSRFLFNQNSFYKEEKTPLQLAFAKGAISTFSMIFESMQNNGQLKNEHLNEFINLTNDDKIKSIIYKYLSLNK